MFATVDGTSAGRRFVRGRSVGARLGALGLMLAAAAAVLAGPGAETSAAEGTASSVTVAAGVGLDGTVTVQEMIAFSGSAPSSIVQTFENRENLVGDRRYVQTVDNIRATSGGKALTVSTKAGSQSTTVTIDTEGASGSVVISYTTSGAVINTTDGTALHWRALQGLSMTVRQFSATVRIPAALSYISCTAGPPNSNSPCGTAAGASENNQTPTFTNGALGQGEVVAVEIGFPAGSVRANEMVDYRWTVGRAFSVSPVPLAIALALLVIGGVGLLVLHRRAGADQSAGGQVARAGEFAPVGEGRSEFRVVSDIRPGHVGTVVDERVDPIDVTASLIDLAVRGHLLITELPRESDFGRTDWLLQRRENGPDDLRPFERELLDATAPVGDEVRVSEIADRVHSSIHLVQDALYDEVVSNGWYERRPDATRGKWTRLALLGLVVAVVVTVLLAAFTTFALIGLVLVILGLGAIFVAQEMPSRTPKGAALLAGLGGLRSDLLTHPTDQMPPGEELRELSEVLPYAVVLGGTDRWLEAIVAADDDADADPEDLSWYHGPDNWHLQNLPESLRNFVTTVSGTLFSR